MSGNLIAGMPTLSSSAKPILTTKERIAAGLIQFLFANPGNTSSVNEGEMMSFTKLVALYGTTNLDKLSSSIGDMLTKSMQHYFPDDNIRAVCNIEYLDGYRGGVYQGNYGIVISFVDHDGIPIIPKNMINAASDGSSFTVLDS